MEKPTHWQRICGESVALNKKIKSNSPSAVLTTAGLLLLLAIRPAQATTNLIINEIDVDTPGTDAAEFIELYDGGTGNTSLNGLILVFYNGNGDKVSAVFDLNEQTTNDAGYFVLCGNATNVANCDLDVIPDTNLIQNGPDAIALYQANVNDFPSGTTPTTNNLLDAIVYDTADDDDNALLVLLNTGQPQVDEDMGGNKNDESIQLCINGNKTSRNTDTYGTGMPTPGAENQCSVEETPPTTPETPDTPTVHLQMRGILQGAYNPEAGLMTDTLRTQSLIPSTQPYGGNVEPGTETLSTTLLNNEGSDAIVDWVMIELRSATSINTKAASYAALLQRDGDIVNPQTGDSTLVFSNIAAGNYYVTLQHRNHLGVMTQSALALSSTPEMIDFSQASTPVYGENARQDSGNLTFLWSGEANNSNNVIGNGPNNDVNVVLGNVLGSGENEESNSNFRLHGYLPTDFNLDGVTLFSGPGNDVNLPMTSIYIHPDNESFSANFMIPGSIPAELAPTQ